MRAAIAHSIALMLLATPASAIVTRHDRPAEAYVVDPKDFPSVAHVLGNTEGTLIAPQWVLTAAHTLEGLDPFSDWRVIIAGQERRFSKIIIHPKRESGTVDSDWDLALLKLDEPVTDVAPTPLYAGRDEPDQIATIVGRGGTRAGAPGGGDYTRDRRMRRATNKVQAAFEHSLVFTFDDARDGTELEGIAGPNDSGGPAFLIKDGTRYLAGVASFSAPNAERGTYGGLDAYTRVSAHHQWIQQVLASDPQSTIAKWSDAQPLTLPARFPDSNSGRIARQFFAAYGPDQAKISKFVTVNGGDAAAFADRTAQWTSQFKADGPLTLHSYRTLGERNIAIRAFAPRTSKWYGFWLILDANDPPRLADIFSGGLPPP